MRNEGLVYASPAVSGNLLPTLMGHWAHDWHEERLDFVYELRTNRLTLREELSDRASVTDFRALALPQRAPATFATREEFIRVRAAPQELRGMHPRIRVTIPYSFRTQRTDVNVPSTKGIVHALLEPMRDFLKSDTITSRLTNRPSGEAPRFEEEGEIEFTGDQEFTKHTTELRQRVREAVVGAARKFEKSGTRTELRVGAIGVSSVTPFALFISSHYASKSEFWKHHGAELKQIVTDEGFVPKTGDAIPGQDIAAHVLETIRECHAMIQIVSMTHEEWATKKNMSWLIAEYAMAMALDIPVKRVIDIRGGDVTVANALNEMRIEPGAAAETVTSGYELVTDRSPGQPAPLRGVLRLLMAEVTARHSKV
jgi:hypothetical protein